MSEKGLRTYRLNTWCDQLGKEISIPIIQRGFVWKPEQIAGLWDSLLRGFPIGSFMVRPIARGSQNVELMVSNGAEVLLAELNLKLKMVLEFGLLVGITHQTLNLNLI